MAYTLMINEYQRMMIFRALLAFRPPADYPAPSGDFGLFPPETSAEAERTMLADLFEDLPASEACTPKAIHGLCL